MICMRGDIADLGSEQQGGGGVPSILQHVWTTSSLSASLPVCIGCEGRSSSVFGSQGLGTEENMERRQEELPFHFCFCCRKQPSSGQRGRAGGLSQLHRTDWEQHVCFCFYSAEAAEAAVTPPDPLHSPQAYVGTQGQTRCLSMWLPHHLATMIWRTNSGILSLLCLFRVCLEGPVVLPLCISSAASTAPTVLFHFKQYVGST